MFAADVSPGWMTTRYRNRRLLPGSTSKTSVLRFIVEEIMLAECVRCEQTVVASVPIGRVLRVLRMIEDCYSELLSIERSRVIHPRRWLPPHVLHFLGAFGVGHRAGTAFLRQFVRQANCEEAFLRIPELDRLVKGCKGDVEINDAIFWVRAGRSFSESLLVALCYRDQPIGPRTRSRPIWNHLWLS